MKKIGLGLLALMLIGAIGFFGIAPGYVERSMNVVSDEPLPEIRPEAQALHDTLTIVDLHSDTLMWRRDVLSQSDQGHMDLARLREGNVALQVFSSVTKSPSGQNYDSNTAEGDRITPLVIGQLQPLRTWNSLLERSLYHAEKLDDASIRAVNALILANSADDIEGILELRTDEWTQKMQESEFSEDWKRPVGALLSIEGLHNLEGDIDNLDRLYEAGFRMASLTHFFDNDLAGSLHGIEKGGLTPMGRNAVRRMEDLGMIIDIAHLSHKGNAELLAMARRPVVFSHGGVQATCDVNRNLTDDEIRGLAATGGVIGVGYWEGAVCGTTPADIVRAMKHIRDLVGIEHVALGSDYDGSVTVPFDTGGLVHLTQALMDAVFTEEEIRAVMGENAMRVIGKGLIPLADLPADDEETTE